MNRKSTPSEQSSTLRAKAEEQLGHLIDANESLSISEKKLLHELQVHQIELEMQNDELQKALIALEASRNRYHNLYEYAPIGYLTLTEKGNIVEVNLTAANLLGVERGNLLNHNFVSLIKPEDTDIWHLLKNSLLQKEHQSFELRLNKGKDYFCALLDCKPLMNGEAKPQLLITITDITDRKKSEEELRIAAVAFETQECIIITNANKEILRVNKAFTDTTGYNPEEVLGKMTNIFRSGRHNENFYNEMWNSIKRKGSWKGEIWDQRQNGEIYPQLLTITAVKDNKGAVTHYVYVHSDISARKASEEAIKQLAYFDPLTTLPNRRLLRDRLQQALATSSRSHKHGALLFIDLDNFKSLNDNVGHDAGDILLQQVAQRLIDCVRESDTVSREGGDEFIVMLEDLSENAEEAAAKAQTTGEKILHSLNQTFRINNRDYQSTPSIGITLFNNHFHTITNLLQRADIAMYGAKAAGRNTLRFFDHAMQEAVSARATMETDLRLALKEKQFQLYFQPQAKIKSSISGAEALLRWNHPDRGLVYPLEFMALAEETRLIAPISAWVLDTACYQLKQWAEKNQTRQLQLSVNISPYQFHQESFVDQVSTLLDNYGIGPNKLTFEITENLAVNHLDDTIHKMLELKKIGIGFSMDNFGSGYSSLAYLAKLPLNQLKIDRSFIHNIGLKSIDTSIVNTIVGMANNLGIQVLAEGVETEAQRTFLEQHNCQNFQGFLLSKPLPIEQFEHLLNA